jgi:hypothetical protein
VLLSLAGDRCNGSTVAVVGAELVERHAITPSYSLWDVSPPRVYAAADAALFE